jgi:hypothetical protein
VLPLHVVALPCFGWQVPIPELPFKLQNALESQLPSALQVLPQLGAFCDELPLQNMSAAEPHALARTLLVHAESSCCSIDPHWKTPSTQVATLWEPWHVDAESQVALEEYDAGQVKASRQQSPLAQQRLPLQCPP